MHIDSNPTLLPKAARFSEANQNIETPPLPSLHIILQLVGEALAAQDIALRITLRHRAQLRRGTRAISFGVQQTRRLSMESIDAVKPDALSVLLGGMGYSTKHTHNGLAAAAFGLTAGTGRSPARAFLPGSPL